MQKRKFKVSGMSCAACSSRVERAVSALDGVQLCSVNLLSGVMSIEGDASDESVVRAVTEAGYSAKPVGGKRPDKENKTLHTTEKINSNRVDFSFILPRPS